MTLVEYLVEVIQSAARIGKLIMTNTPPRGEAPLFPTETKNPDEPLLRNFWIAPRPAQMSLAEAYSLLGETVSSLNLNEALEDAIWSLPLYRSFMEADLSLDCIFSPSSHTEIHVLIESTCRALGTWSKVGSPTTASQAEVTEELRRLEQKLLRLMDLKPRLRIIK